MPEGVTGSRMPEWLLPNTPAEDRTRMRPDILILPDFAHGTPHGSVTPHNAPNGAHIIEVGYCSDTRVQDKREEKEKQHDRLAEALTAHGWKVTKHVIPLGNTGIIYTNIRDTLQALGVEDAHRTNKTLAKLNCHAVEYMQHIITKRRKLECTEMDQS